MAESPEHAEIEPRGASTNSIMNLLKDPLVRELVIPIIKKEAGLGGGGHNDKELARKWGGRLLLGLRDFMQGTWWVVVLFSLGMSLVVIIFLVLRKWLGV